MKMDEHLKELRTKLDQAIVQKNTEDLRLVRDDFSRYWRQNHKFRVALSSIASSMDMHKEFEEFLRGTTKNLVDLNWASNTLDLGIEIDVERGDTYLPDEKPEESEVRASHLKCVNSHLKI